MLPKSPLRDIHWPTIVARKATWGLSLIFFCSSYSAIAQQQASNPADSPASVPAGAVAALPLVSASKHPVKSPLTHLSEKQLREADDAYLEGAKQVDHKNLAAAEHDFEQAVHLNPDNRDYTLALIVTRENYVTELVQHAAQARAHGDQTTADSLLAKAHVLDPDNLVVRQHFDSLAPPVTAKNRNKLGLFYASVDPNKTPAQDIAATLTGPVELTPLPGKRNIHLHGDPQSVIRNLYSLYGIATSFDASITGGPAINLDMDNVDFTGATRVLDIAADIFAIPVQPKTVLIAKDTQENRAALMPQVEETVYLPGRTNDEMQELANVARNIFDVKEVTASATGGYMLLRGDSDVLREVNAVYDNMLDGDSDVQLDINVYELDKTATNNIGATLPGSISGFDVLSSAQNLITSNQSLINQAVASGLISLTGSSGANELTELAFLIAAGVSGASQFTNLLGVLGTDGGLPLAGLSLASGTTFNLALNTTDARMLDSLQLRSSNHQPATFRVGTRYPVITGTYSSGVSSSLASSLAGLNINGTSVSSLLSQYLGSSTASVPEFQFEDLGITLKLTPQILHSSEVSVALDMKIEALAGSSIDDIPILNNRALTSTITIPAGYTAMLATLVNTNEVKGLTGLPGLSELPGFQGTDQDIEKNSTELLITITPHIMRTGRIQISSRRLDTIRTGKSPAPDPSSLSAPSNSPATPATTPQ